MSYIRCPYCGRSDGNDDMDIKREIISMDATSCQIVVEKECDICGRHYSVERYFKLQYERLGGCKSDE